MDANKFNIIKDRARKLIQMDNAGEIDRIAEAKRRDGSLTSNEDGDVTYTASAKNQSQMINEGYSSYEETPITFNTPASKKLPKEIVESFKKTTIDTTSFAPETSVLDQMGITPPKRQKPVRTQINEEISHPTSVVSNGGSIDYSLIKMIVEESVKKYMNAYTKKIINESANKGGSNPINTIQMGEKFNFVTKNGDLYEAQLKFVKNLKEK